MLSKSISTDEKLTGLSVNAVLLYTWCIPHQDVGGKLIANPAVVKGTVVPFRKEFDEKEIERCLAELAREHLVIIYSSKGSSIIYMKMLGFHKNNKVDESKEAPSSIPEPPEELLLSYSGATPRKCNIIEAGTLSVSKPCKPSLTTKPYIIKDSPQDRIIHRFKEKKGIPREDRDWNAANYKRCLKSLSEYAKNGGKLDDARFEKAFAYVAARFEETWTLETAIRYIAEANKSAKPPAADAMYRDMTEYYNRVTKSQYEVEDMAEILRRLSNKGYTLKDLKSVVAFKIVQWRGTDNEKHLTPTTLFKESNFKEYLIEAREHLRKEQER